MQGAVDEVGRVAAAEGIDCHFSKGGTVVAGAARRCSSSGPAPRWPRRAAGASATTTCALLGADEATRTGSARPACSAATYTPHCAAIHPARLVRGLARAVERLGVRVYERHPVTAIEPGGVVTTARHGAGRRRGARDRGLHRRSCPGMRRDVAPVYSLMVATEPLPDDVLGADRAARSARRSATSGTSSSTGSAPPTAGWRSAAAARRTTSARGSGREHDRDAGVFAELRQVLVDLLPAVRGAAFTHAWGGPLGIPRDWCASVGLDRATGLAWAGGYVGDGVSTTNLAGRTLADLVLERDSDLVRLPWVDHRSRALGARAVALAGRQRPHWRMMGGADAEEVRTGRPSRRAALLERFTGH